MDLNRTRRLQLSVAGAVIAMAGAVVMGQPAASAALNVGARWSAAARQLAPTEAAAAVTIANARLRLAASDVYTLGVRRSPAGAVDVVVPFEGVRYSLMMKPSSVRSASYEVLTQVADGSLVSVQPGAEQTLRGHVRGMAGSVVAGALNDSGLTAVIHLPDGRTLWTEPLSPRAAGVAGDVQVAYLERDALPSGGSCAVEGRAIVLGGQASAAGAACGGGFCVATVAIDADHEFFIRHGSSVSSVEARINTVINTVNVQYERDVSITHRITTIIVRTAEPDPFSSTDPSVLLNQLRAHWEAVLRSVPRDTVHLFTGKQLDGNVIGVAFLRGFCSSFGYGLSQSDFTTSFACVTDLTAHEIGHNWGANHCTCSSNTMNPSIRCANVFHPTLTVPTIGSFRDSIMFCLDVEVPSVCGNGVVEGTEQCDPPDGVTCNADCTVNACGTATGDCCATHSSAGCNNSACCNAVCAQDPACCDVFWDASCKRLAQLSASCDCPECFADSDCDDTNPCTTNTCVNSLCVATNNTDLCEDGAYCNGVEQCVDGACTPGTNPCGGQQCDEVNQVCIVTDTLFSCSPQRVIAGAGESIAVDAFVSEAFNLGGYSAAVSVLSQSGGGGATIGCPNGVQIDFGRSDYVYFGSSNIVPSADCATGLLGTSLLTGGVNVTGARGYLGTFLVDVDAATADGSVFLVAFSPFQSELRDANGVVIPFSVGAPCRIVVGPCTDVTYGDIDGNGVINLFDIVCVLKTLQGRTDGCRVVQADIAPCGGDGVVDVLDLMATLDTFSAGVAACPNPCVPPLSVTRP